MPPARARQAVRCVTCNTDDELYCGGCYGGVGDGDDNQGFMHVTWICSPKCAVTDEPEHEEVCPNVQAQEMLYRAAGLLQKLFYTFREVGYRRKIVRIGQKDGKVIFHENYDAPRGTVFFSTGLISKERVLNQKDKEAILSYDGSSVAVACMHEAIKYVLSFLTSNITEVSFQPKNSKRTAVVKGADGTEIYRMKEHEVLRVVMRCGATFALDLAGAQFGYHDQPLTPYVEYAMNRAEVYVVRKGFAYFGGLRDRHTQLVDTEAFKGLQLARARVNKALGETVLVGVKYWEERAHLSVHQLMTILHENVFEHGEDQVVKATQEVLLKRMTAAMVVARRNKETEFEQYL